MKLLAILLIIGAVAMGLFDGRDMTGALVLAVFLLPGVFHKDNKEKAGEAACREKIKAQ